MVHNTFIMTGYCACHLP